MPPDPRLAAAMSRIDATLTAKRQQRAANHSQAPICGAFVADLRAAFGSSVAVTYVREGDFQLGTLPPGGCGERGEIVVTRTKGRREVEVVVAQWVRE